MVTYLIKLGNRVRNSIHHHQTNIWNVHSLLKTNSNLTVDKTPYFSLTIPKAMVPTKQRKDDDVHVVNLS